MINQDRKVALNTRQIPEKLRDRFKGFCAERGVPMNDAIIWMMEFLVDGSPCVELGLRKFPSKN